MDKVVFRLKKKVRYKMEKLNTERFAVFYGVTDVTEIVYEKYVQNGFLKLPACAEDRAVILNGALMFFENNKEIALNLNKALPYRRVLSNIQSNRSIDFGSFSEEFPEQLLAVKYIRPSAVVLEIGGNIGRNSIVIASLLDNEENLVTLESDPESVGKLILNRNKNAMSFHIEPSALSKRKLIQKGWETIPSEVVQDGYFPVSIISFDELKTKYNKNFDTLVADCEGALYYILKDEPKLLENIHTVIIENDFSNAKHKTFVDNVMRKEGLQVFFRKEGGWGPCQCCFYEVWCRCT